MTKAINETSAKTQEDPFFQTLGDAVDRFHKKKLPKDTLYHYTSYTGLKGIIKSQELWLTDYRDLNDTSEIKNSLEQIEELIKNVTKSSYYKNIFWDEFFKLFKDVLNPDTYKIYICSFCKQKDYLPAWEKYGDNAAGFAIGYRKKFFEPKKNGNINDKSYSQTNIYYRIADNELQMCINDLITLTEKQLAILNEANNNTRIINNDQVLLNLFSYILVLLPSLKKLKFQPEHEYRILYYDLKNSSKINVRKIFRETKQKSSYCRSIRYFPKEFGIDDICEICIGPHNNFKHSSHDITKLLLDNDFDDNKVKITKSDLW